MVPKVMASIRLVTDGVLYGQTTPQPGHEGIPNHRECAGKAGDHRRTPKAHLSPRQHIANKGGENTQEQEEHTHTPHKHAPCMAHREAAEQMQVDREKEQTRTVGVGMAEQPPAVDLAQNVFYGHSGTNHVGRVVHRKNDAGHDLNLQTDAAKATKSPKSVQETRRWIVE